MKVLLRNIWLGLAALSAVLTTGCKESEPELPLAKIEITNVSSTYTSVTFTLKATDAVKYSYVVSEKDATPGTPTMVEGKETSTETVKGLEANKQYVIKAIAYNADGIASPEKTHAFETDPVAKMVIEAPIVAGGISAEVTFKPTNATEYAYVCYKSSETQPEASKWTTIKGNEAKTVTIDKLANETEYTVAAQAKNNGGEGEIVTETFKTLPGAKVALMGVKFYKTVGFSVDFPADQYSGVIISRAFNLNQEGNEYPKTPAEFCDKVFADEEFVEFSTATAKVSGWHKLPGECMDAAGVAQTIYYVMLDKKGEMVETTAATLTYEAVDTQSEFVFDSAATATMEVMPNDMSISVKPTLSEDAVMFYVECVATQDLWGNAMDDVWFAENYYNLPFKSRVDLDEKGMYTITTNIRPSTDYSLCIIPVDKDGKLGAMEAYEAKTKGVEFGTSATATVELAHVFFKAASVKVTLGGDATHVAASFINKSMYETNFDSDPAKAAIELALYDPSMIKQLKDGILTEQLFGMPGEKDFVCIVVPMKAVEGEPQWGMPTYTVESVGQPVVVPFTQLTYTPDLLGGEASVAIEEVKIEADPENYIDLQYKFKLTPDDKCVAYMYFANNPTWMQGSHDVSGFDPTNDAHLAEALAKSSQPVVYPAVAVDGTSDKVSDLSITPSGITQGEWAAVYILALDKNGKWSFSKSKNYESTQGTNPGPEPEDPDPMPEV